MNSTACTELDHQVKRLTAIEIALRLGSAAHDPELGLICRCPSHPAHSEPTFMFRDYGDRLFGRCVTGCDMGIVFAELRWRGLTPPADPKDEYRPVPPTRGAP